LKYRWVLIFISVVVKMMISIYQYSWFLFAYSIHKELVWDLETLGIVFTLFVCTSTLIQPISGFVSDTQGPRKIAIAGAILVGLGFVLSSFGKTPLELYAYYAVGGLGVGILNGIATSAALKWFPDKRGFATGLVEFGFGGGTALFNLMIQALLESSGFKATFFYVGTFMWVILVPGSIFLKYPPRDLSGDLGRFAESPLHSSPEFRPFQVFQTYQWYAIYFSFAFIVSVVLIFAAQMKMVASEFAVKQHHLNLLLVLFPVGNGLSRIAAGVVSDKLGRERTMFLYYTVLGGAMFSLGLLGHYSSSLFVCVVFICALLAGSPFVLYPAILADYFGTRYSTTLFGIMITAKMLSGLISGWLTATLVLHFGTYKPVLYLLAILCIVAAIISGPHVMRRPSVGKGEPVLQQ
jgi:OFA family oxalate/formate antiporter-like MFS transporter